MDVYNNLAHFGIKNMKWGVRNYQNKDGSLTTLGRIRYGSPRGKMIKKSVDLYENFPKRQPGESDKAYLKRYNKHDAKWASSYHSLDPIEQVAADNEVLRHRINKQRKMAMKYAIAGIASGTAAGAIAGPAVGTAVGSAVVIGAANTAGRHNSIQAYMQNRKVYKRTKKEIGRQVRESLDHDDLYHYGIKGQKRGVRRYQNTDGSLTPAGKQHYGVGVLQLLGSHKDKAPAQSGSSKPNLKIGLAAGSKKITATMNSTGRMNSEGRLTKWHDRRRALSYAKGARERSQALKAYDKTGNASGKEAAESRMSIAGRDLSGAAKASGIARLQNRTAIGKYAKSAAYAAAGVGASVALANPAPLALGAASIKNLWQGNRARKKSNIAKEFAKEHYNDESDYLPENIVDIENKYYRYHPNRRHAKHSDLAHFGIKNMKWGQRRYQNPDGSLTAEGKIRYRSMTPDGKLRYGSLMSSGKIRPKDPRTQQIKDYGSYRDYADQHHNLSRSRLTNPYQKIEALKNKRYYMKKANKARIGLTAAEQAAGMAEAQRKNKIINAFGSGISGVGGAVMSATGLAGIKAATSAVAIGASSTALAGGLPFIAAGGYMVGQYIRARRAEKMYRKYAKENWNDPNVELPWPLEFYGKYDNKTQKKAYKDYKKDPINLGRQYEPDSINEPEIPKKYYKKYSKRKQNTPMNIPSDRQWQQFNHHQDMLMQQNILNDINRISNETTMMNMHMMDPNIGF